MFSTLPNYLAFMATSISLLVAGLAVYLQITPYRELALIREGNRAAAFSFGGTAIGLALAIYGVGSSTFHWQVLGAWGAVGLVSQIIAFLVISRLLGNFKESIEQDKCGYGITLGCLSIAIGLINSAALSG